MKGNLRDKLQKFKRMSNVNDFFYVFETKQNSLISRRV